MRLQLSGSAIPGELIDTVAALTDRARLRYAEVVHDSAVGTVSLPIIRRPLIRRRKVLPNIHASRNPIPAMITVRNVVSCEIENNAPPDLGDEVLLLFGIQVQETQVYVSPAEEDRGRPCFSATIGVSELDLEIADS